MPRHHCERGTSTEPAQMPGRGARRAYIRHRLTLWSALGAALAIVLIWQAGIGVN